MSYKFLARIRKDGKITIPKEVRDLLNLNSDDIYEFIIRKPDWWEMVDWNEVSQEAFDELPEETKQKIRNSEIIKAIGKVELTEEQKQKVRDSERESVAG